MKIVVTDRALEDLKRLRIFLAEKDVKAGERAKFTLIEAIESLTAFPERGRPSVLSGTRELVVKFWHSAYIVRYAYRPSADAVYIYRVWHGRKHRH